MSLLLDSSFKTVQDLNRYRKDLVRAASGIVPATTPTIITNV
jgi:hypothetical protein